MCLCPACSAKNAVDSRFCAACGAALTQEARPLAVTQPVSAESGSGMGTADAPASTARDSQKSGGYAGPAAAHLVATQAHASGNPLHQTPTTSLPGGHGSGSNASPGGNRYARSASASPAEVVVSPNSHGRFYPGMRVAERYRIVSLVGKGGMGEVYRADDLRLGHSVALKFLPMEVANHADRLQNFLSEVRLSRQVSHPNVCRVYDLGEVDGHTFLSMEYVDGEDLKSLLRRIGRLPLDKGVEIARQLCLGLAALHEQGLLHRDLKPANIMLDGRGQVRIMDFGLALPEREASPEAGLFGTPAYMAPEQFFRGETSNKSDLYSLGLVLYEIFTGKALRQATTLTELKAEISDPTKSVSIARLVEGVDPSVDRLVARLLEMEPADRPKSAQFVAAALPGGDPLAAALAAGETPSPEMVAAAGICAAMPLRTGVLCLAGLVAALLVAGLAAEKSHLVNNPPLQRAPAVLADKAKEIVTSLGYSEAPAESSVDFVVWREEVRFWYRQTPRPVLVNRFWQDVQLGTLSRGSPLAALPVDETLGVVSVILNGDGKLRGLLAVPPRPEPAVEQTVTPWHEWFSPERTGLDLQAMQELPVPENMVPKNYTTRLPQHDRMAAWKGLLPDTGEEATVVAASYRNKPVFLAVIDSKGLQPTLLARAAPKILLVFSGVLLFGSAGLALYNLRQGRGDRRGAFRAAAYVFVISMLAWLFEANHLVDLSEERVMELGLAQSLWMFAMLWLWYVGMEPFVRRYWPDVLITTSRLLHGRVGDVRVGRDLLIGALVGAMGAICWQLNVILPAWMGLPPAPPLKEHLSALTSTSTLLAQLMMANIMAIYVSGFYVMMMLLLRMLLRREALALPICWAVVTSYLVALNGGSPVVAGLPLIAVVCMGLQAGLVLHILRRFGLLATHAALFTHMLLVFPLTLDSSRWYAGSSWLILGIILAIASHGFFLAVGGKCAFKNVWSAPGNAAP